MKSSFIPDFFERYADRYKKDDVTGCVNWIASKTPTGYGTITFELKSYYAHRASFEAVNGKYSASSLLVRHSCDNPRCINPDHLLLGTHKDNSRDAVERGRVARNLGEKSGAAKLTNKVVRAMRGMAIEGMPVCEIQRKFNFSWGTIYNAIIGVSWGHLSGAVDPDKVAKSDRKPDVIFGEKSPRAILTNIDVVNIRARLSNGESGLSLSKEYGVSPSTISSIKTRRNRRHG